MSKAASRETEEGAAQMLEYTSFVVKVGDSPDTQLNQLGGAGWELGSVIAVEFSLMAHGNPKASRYVLKRAES